MATKSRRASEKDEKYRFAKNVDGDATVAEREYQEYAAAPDDELKVDPDVLLDIPAIKVDKIHLKLADLKAHVALQAQVLDLVDLSVGVDVELDKLEVDIEGVEAQALLKVRLDHIAAVVDRVLTTIDRNPDLVHGLSQAVEDVGAGAGDMVGEAGEAVEEVGEGAEDAVGEIGEGAGQAVGEIGEGAGQAAGEIGEGAGQAVGEAGEGAGQALGDVQGLVGQAGQAAGGLGQGAGQAAGGLGQAAGGLAGGEQGEEGGDAASGGGDLTAPKLAKEAAKVVGKELAAAATDEAKDLGVAATRKVMELGERRRQRRAEKHHATEAAMRHAQELGVDLDEVEGSGSDGRITVRDVKEAADEE